MRYTFNVWVGGVYDTFNNIDDANNKKHFWISKGYNDVHIEIIKII